MPKNTFSRPDRVKKTKPGLSSRAVQYVIANGKLGPSTVALPPAMAARTTDAAVRPLSSMVGKKITGNRAHSVAELNMPTAKHAISRLPSNSSVRRRRSGWRNATSSVRPASTKNTAANQPSRPLLFAGETTMITRNTLETAVTINPPASWAYSARARSRVTRHSTEFASPEIPSAASR